MNLGKLFYAPVASLPLPVDVQRMIWGYLVEDHPTAKIMKKILTLDGIISKKGYKHIHTFFLYLCAYLHENNCSQIEKSFFSAAHFEKKFQFLETRGKTLRG